MKTFGVVGDTTPFAPGEEDERLSVEADPLQDEMVKIRGNKKKWAELTAYIDHRIAFYQGWLPDGQPLTTKESMVLLGQQWVIANAVIAEMENFRMAIEGVYDAAKQRPTSKV